MARVRPGRALRVLVICAVVSGSLWAQSTKTSKPPTPPSTNTPQQDAAEAVFSSAASKVVFLITRESGELHATASGVILTADGYVATNYHALQGADAVEIRFFPDPADTENYQSFNGSKLLYADAERDIAILKVNSKSLPFLECPASGCDARVGETVYAIGNPMGLSNTISQGIVSALRSVDKEEMVQHTAAISPGSSGGALVDSNGALLGINSWQVRDAQNLNFAIAAKYLTDALAAARRATTPLSFPPEGPAESLSAAQTDAEEKAWQALQSKDFLQAVNEARAAFEAGKSNSRIYMILGVADYALGNLQESEQYLRQALLLSGPDDEFKNTSRLYLLRIVTARMSDQTGSADRLALIQLVQEVLGSNSGSIEDPADYAKMREWAASLTEWARSITGSWVQWESSATSGRPDPTSRSGLLDFIECGTDRYDISAASGGFTLGSGGSGMNHGTCHLTGTVTKNGDGFVGEVTRTVVVNPSLGIGYAEQTLHIQFKLSDDLKTIEGTASAGDIASGGANGEYAADILVHGQVGGALPWIGRPTRPPRLAPWHFTLHR